MENIKDGLGDRMKGYEAEFKTMLPARSWSVLRLDGKAFHTWTKAFEKPYSKKIVDAMEQSMVALCEQIPSVVCAYQQSDELSLVMQSFAKEDTQSWYGGQVQKMVSVAASIMTAEFGRYFPENKIALFDARCFVLPNRVEVANNLFWRQLDGKRNAISAIASSIFSDRELFGKSTEERHKMIENSGYDLQSVDPRFMQGQFAFKVEKRIVDFVDKRTGNIVKLQNPAIRGVWQSSAAPDLNAKPDGILLQQLLSKDPT